VKKAEQMIEVKGRSFRPYPKYKDSGIEWLEQIPEGWSVVPLKRKFSVCLGKMLQNQPGTSRDELKPYIRAANIQWNGVDFSDIKEMWFSPKEMKVFRLKRGDLLVSEGGDVGRASIWTSDEEMYIQNAVNRVRSKGGDVTHYLFYYMYMLKHCGYIDLLCNKATISHYTAEKVEASPIVSPSLAEQEAIAGFLDCETAKIDALAAKKEKLIELLQEKRTALITHAVTKGLDPHVPMKDSGVEWVGEIPAHWKAKRLKYAARILNGYAFDSETYVDNGVPIVRIGDVRPNIEWSQAKRVSADMFERMPQFRIRNGDILMALTGATIGKSAVYRYNDEALLNQRVGAIRGVDLHQDYLAYFVASKAFTESIDFLCYGGAQANIGKSDIGGVITTIPGLDEQLLIVAFLDSATKKIDALIAEIQGVIEHLKEYRIALISAAVTGKINVREEVG
jgi:type I restriction enzyme S subunit